MVSELEQRAVDAERRALEYQNERDQLQSDIDAECQWRRKFRIDHGAREDESMIYFLERLARERDELRKTFGEKLRFLLRELKR